MRMYQSFLCIELSRLFDYLELLLMFYKTSSSLYIHLHQRNFKRENKPESQKGKFTFYSNTDKYTFKIESVVIRMSRRTKWKSQLGHFRVIHVCCFVEGKLTLKTYKFINASNIVDSFFRANAFGKRTPRILEASRCNNWFDLGIQTKQRKTMFASEFRFIPRTYTFFTL